MDNMDNPDNRNRAKDFRLSGSLGNPDNPDTRPRSLHNYQ